MRRACAMVLLAVVSAGCVLEGPIVLRPRDGAADAGDGADIATDAISNDLGMSDSADVPPVDVLGDDGRDVVDAAVDTVISDVPRDVAVDAPADTTGCPAPCGANSSCVAGSCVCSAGFGDCNRVPSDGCEVRLIDNPAHCGSCGRNCAACCGTVCADLNNDPSHCGACGVSCGGRACCGGTCIDTATNNLNCGACGSVCSTSGSRFQCCAGTCRDTNNCSMCCPGSRCAPCFNALCGC